MLGKLPCSDAAMFELSTTDIIVHTYHRYYSMYIYIDIVINIINTISYWSLWTYPVGIKMRQVVSHKAGFTTR